MIRKGFYVSDSSELLVEILSIRYRDQNGEYVKVKVNISNKNNGILYETNKTYKLILENIRHWKRV